MKSPFFSFPAGTARGVFGNTDIRCIGIQDPNHTSCDHTSTFPTIFNTMSNVGFYSHETFEEIHATTLMGMMSKSKIIVINSHGTKTKIILNNSDFSISTISSLPNNAYENTKLVLYVACETGSGGANANNLVNATASKGVGIVIGFQETIYCGESDIWVNAFFASLGNGNTVSAAIDDAALAVQIGWQSDQTTQSYYGVGNLNQTITNW